MAQRDKHGRWHPALSTTAANNATTRVAAAVAASLSAAAADFAAAVARVAAVAAGIATLTTDFTTTARLSTFLATTTFLASSAQRPSSRLWPPAERLGDQRSYRSKLVGRCGLGARRAGPRGVRRSRHHKCDSDSDMRRPILAS